MPSRQTIMRGCFLPFGLNCQEKEVITPMVKLIILLDWFVANTSKMLPQACVVD